MSTAPMGPQAEQFAIARAALMHRMRWLAPNSRRGRELAAEIRRLAREELKLEVAAGLPLTRPAEPATLSPEGRGEEAEAPRFPRLWWVERD